MKNSAASEAGAITALQRKWTFLFRRTSIPSVPTIRHICEAMGITISQFYSTDGSAATITEQQKAFLELFDRLSPGDKKKAEGYIEGLLAKSQSEP